MGEKLAIHGGEKAVSVETPEKLALRPNWPIVGEEETREVVEAMRRNDITSPAGGGVMEEFEEAFAKYVGVKYCVTTNSCCSATHIALGAFGVGPGDEVIVSPYTWGQTVAPIIHQNGIPVYADIDPRTYNLDAESVAKKVTQSTKAIVVVHIYGHPADMDPIMEVAEDNDLKVVEDCAQATGAAYHGRKVGSLGHMSSFSIGDGKNMVGGEGGMIMTDDDDLHERAMFVGMHPARSDPVIKDPELRRYIDSLMPTYRMHPLAAAIAKVQLKYLDEWNSWRRRHAGRFSAGLEDIAGVEPAYVAPDCEHVYHMYSPTYRAEELGGLPRERFLEALRAEGVSVGAYVQTPIYLRTRHQERYYYGKGCPWDCPHALRRVVYRKGDCPVAEERCEKTELNVGSTGWYGPQFGELIGMYLEAFQKVVGHAGQL
jgi:dTDP-4-amino-4,6-dideoxygalactose transaminase